MGFIMLKSSQAQITQLKINLIVFSVTYGSYVKSSEFRLIKVIYKTIDGFNKKYPIDKNQLNKVPFYHSQILFEELNKYVLLKKNEDIGSLKEKFKQNPNIQTSVPNNF